MSTAALTDLDIRLREHVLHQLEWDPEVEVSGVAVAAKDGIVTLAGAIDTYAGKLAAERAAKRVRGVRAVANDLDVRLTGEHTDADIARDAVRALALQAIPESVQVVVHDGHVTLTGSVRWFYQAREAEEAVRHITGVRGVFNHIQIRGGAVAHDVHHAIVQVLHRDADLDAHRITVGLAGPVVTLSGAVATWQQRDAAERAAAGAPGITRVDNEIRVEPVEPVDEIC